ncbi:MliC family protein [Thiorhodococcus fuscus]|uniref:MliC family protein n=1 Tax=Thiorhodococcus fuscus TaxID=527200 RepID=A0ABW4Y6L2_9GAMM
MESHPRRLKWVSVVLIQAILAGTACAQPPSHIDRYAYRCESGATLISAYDPQTDTMRVQYRDQVLTLVPVRSGSGAKFGGSDVPWGWWSKGTEGFVFGYAADGTDDEILDRCGDGEILDEDVQEPSES